MSRKSQERRYASARSIAEKQTSGFSYPYLKLPQGASLYQPKEGLAFLNVLDYEVGDGNPNAEEGMLTFERTFWVHRGIGPNNETHLCAAKTFGKKCPVCEYRARLRREGDEDKEDLIADLGPRERQIFNIDDLKHPDKGVQILEMSNFCFGKVLNETINAADDEEQDDFDNFSRLERGLTLKVNWVEDSFGGTTFTKAGSITFKPRKRQYDQDEMLEKVFCLDELIVETPYDKLKSILLAEEDEDDDEDDEPKKKAKPSEDDDDDRPAKKKSRPSEDEDDEDDDEDDEPKKKAKPSEDDDDDDDDRPVKKKAKPSEDDDDWDDFNDDDDEPKKKSRPSEDDDDDRPAKKKARPSEDDDDDEEEERPHIKTKDERMKELEEDDDDRPAKKKAKSSDEEDDDDWDDQPRNKSKK